MSKFYGCLCVIGVLFVVFSLVSISQRPITPSVTSPDGFTQTVGLKDDANVLLSGPDLPKLNAAVTDHANPPPFNLTSEPKKRKSRGQRIAESRNFTYTNAGLIKRIMMSLPDQPWNSTPNFTRMPPAPMIDVAANSELLLRRYVEEPGIDALVQFVERMATGSSFASDLV